MDSKDYDDMVKFIKSDYFRYPGYLREANTKSLKNKKCFYRRKAEKFTVQNNVLYRLNLPKVEDGVRVAKKEQIREIMEAAHCKGFGPHRGINSTLNFLRDKFWWFGISDDIKEYVNSCEKCKLANAIPRIRYRMLKKYKIEQQQKMEDQPPEKMQKLEDPDDEPLEPLEFRFTKRLSLEKIRSVQEKFCAERNWDQFHTPRNLVLALVGEVGELAEIFQWKGEVEVGLPEFTKEEKDHVGQELSDVLVYLIRLADQCRIDLPTAVMAKIEQNRAKYPVDKAYGKSWKYTAYLNGDNGNTTETSSVSQQEDDDDTMKVPLLSPSGGTKAVRVSINYPSTDTTTMEGSRTNQRRVNKAKRQAQIPVQDYKPSKVSSIDPLQGKNPVTASSTFTLQGKNPVTTSTLFTLQGKNPVTTSPTLTLQDKNPVAASSTFTLQVKNPVTASSLFTLQGKNPVTTSSLFTLQGKNPVTASPALTLQDKNPVAASSTFTLQGKNPVTASPTLTLQGKNPVKVSLLDSSKDKAPVKLALTGDKNPMTVSVINSAGEKTPVTVSLLNTGGGKVPGKVLVISPTTGDKPMDVSMIRSVKQEVGVSLLNPPKDVSSASESSSDSKG